MEAERAHEAEYGLTALHRAAEACDFEAVQTLLDKGADVNARTRQGKTPLTLAMRRPNAERLIHLLLDRGADINAAFGGSLTALHLAVLNNDPSVVLVLLARGANPNAGAEVVGTPLHLSENPSVINLLLAHGADPNAPKRDGSTPLHVIARSENHEAAQILLSRGADPNAKNAEGATPLHLACLYCARNSQIVSVLLRGGACAAAADVRGRTPLHWALGAVYCSDPIMTLAKLLLAAGAPLDARDADGRRPEDYIDPEEPGGANRLALIKAERARRLAAVAPVAAEPAPEELVAVRWRPEIVRQQTWAGWLGSMLRWAWGAPSVPQSE